MERAVDIGKLNKRITFQRRAGMTDCMGQDTLEQWEDMRTVWADFYPVRGGESQEAERKVREEIVYKAKLRYLPDIDSSMRIKFRGRIFLIGSVLNVDEADYKMEIECTEYIEKEAGDDGYNDQRDE